MRQVLGLFFCLAGFSHAYAGGFVDQLVQQHFEKVLNQLDQQQSMFSVLTWALGPSIGATPDGTQLPTEGEFDQLIDPSNPSDTRTFKQRYYVNGAYASGPDAPVFFYLCGEATCTSRSLKGAIETYAHKYGGTMIALEHRYYGKSQPFQSFTSENLKYLRTEFAIEDLARFQSYAQKRWGLKGKWISLGGSYPGSLSAYYRLKHPELIAGALASSAPVYPKENFEEYDWTVHDRVGPQCAAAIKSTVAQIEAALNDPAALLAIKKTFRAEEIRDPMDFLYIVADMIASAVQYGMKDTFCQTLLAPGSDLISAYAKAGNAAFTVLGITPYQDSFQALDSLDPNSYIDGFGGRQWMYQSCTEFGYFQVAFHDPAQSARSSKIDLNFHHRICGDLFGTPPVDTSNIQIQYYQPLLDASISSKILLTNGGDDPWANLSISSSLGNATNPNLTAYTILGAAHCDDLRTPATADSLALTQARNLFTGLMDQWLK